MTWPNSAIMRHGPNTRGGRDLVVGDIHGHFDTLEHALAGLAFDPAADRLFSVGDLVDRGPRSHAALEWIGAGRILPVRGNHDQLMIEALAHHRGRLRSAGPSQWWEAMGGAWWFRRWEGAQSRWGYEEKLTEECERWLRALRRVPFLRTIDTGAGRVGIAHTLSGTEDWTALEAALEALAGEAREQPPQPYVVLPESVDAILWSRPEIEREDRSAKDLPPAIPGIDLVVTGHTPGREPRWTRRNVLCIDTGVFVPEYGHLTIGEVHTGAPRLHRFATIEGTGHIL